MPIFGPGAVDLRFTARAELADTSPDAVVEDAARQALAVFGITDSQRVDRIPSIAARALRAGLWPVPGIRLHGGDSEIFAWGFDYQDRALLGLLEHQRLDLNAALQRIAATGGLIFDARNGDAAPGHRIRPVLLPTNTEHFEDFLARVPPLCLLRDWFDRMRWRLRNLPEAELEASLWPEEISIETPCFQYLADLSPVVLPPAAHPLPFLLVSPSGLGSIDRIRALAMAHATLRCEQFVPQFAELAWRLYRLDQQERNQRLRATLRFELDRVLHGRSAGHLFVFEPGDIDLGALKVRIRTLLRPRVWRARLGERADTCVSSFVHLPDRDRLGHEFAWLEKCGVTRR